MCNLVLLTTGTLMSWEPTSHLAEVTFLVLICARQFHILTYFNVAFPFNIMSKIELKSSSEVAPTPLMSVQIGRLYQELQTLDYKAPRAGFTQKQSHDNVRRVILKTRFVVGTSTE